MPLMQSAMVPLDYEPPRVVRWRWPGWLLVLTWLPFSTVGASAGAYVATLAFWGEFRPEAWYVVPSRVLAGCLLAAVVASPLLPFARMHASAKIAIALLVAVLVTFGLTFFELFALWGP